MEDFRLLDEDWPLLLSLFPPGWDVQAVLRGASERLRGFGSVGDLLRTLLLHVGPGYSLRETVVRAKAVGLAEVSDVALLKRLRKAEAWWRWLCRALLQENGWEMPTEWGGRKVRILDGTLIKEPGARGQQRRIHYSLRVPSLECDYFELTPVAGPGNGEVLDRFPGAPGDLVLADRGFAKPPGIEALTQQGADVIVRLNTSSLPLFTADGGVFPLREKLREIQRPGQVAEWNVVVHGPKRTISGRLCVIRKSEEATRRAQQKILRKAQKGGPQVKPETLEYAAYVMVFTTLPASEFSTEAVLEGYRGRWQVELVFKRMKSLLQLGHLPKHDHRSARAWLYGKLLVALLGHKLMRLGRDISPWGYRLWQAQEQQRLAAV